MKYMKKVMKFRLCYMHGEDESCIRGSLMFLTTVKESLDRKKLKMIQTTIEKTGWPRQYVNACQYGNTVEPYPCQFVEWPEEGLPAQEALRSLIQEAYHRKFVLRFDVYWMPDWKNTLIPIPISPGSFPQKFWKNGVDPCPSVTPPSYARTDWRGFLASQEKLQDSLNEIWNGGETLIDSADPFTPGDHPRFMELYIIRRYYRMALEDIKNYRERPPSPHYSGMKSLQMQAREYDDRWITFPERIEDSEEEEKNNERDNDDKFHDD